MSPRTVVYAAALLLFTAPAPLPGQTLTLPACRASGAPARVAELIEGSGLAASRAVPGRFWSHNDSGTPQLFALNQRGAVTGRVRVEGATLRDWEALAVGPCRAGSCLYIGDIGDNDAERPHVTVYRVPEPSETLPASVRVLDTFELIYPDGPRNAETLLVGPDGRIAIVTKGDGEAPTVYRVPAGASPGKPIKLERAGPPRGAAAKGGDKITDGAMSPDGTWVVLRSTTAAAFYRASDLLAGRWREERRVTLKPLNEPQGEAIAVAADNRLYVAGEGGGGKRPGTFAQLACDAPAHR